MRYLLVFVARRALVAEINDLHFRENNVYLQDFTELKHVLYLCMRCSLLGPNSENVLNA